MLSLKLSLTSVAALSQGVPERFVENGAVYYLLRDDDTGEVLRDDDTNQPLYDEVAA
jgi:hypothetical protein